jgi:dihydroceramidase
MGSTHSVTATAGPAMEPFWGPVTSNVDWCERNYSHTSYIAEFYNTLSSLPMIWMGLVGMIECRRLRLPKQYGLSFFALFVVGIGSVLFHSTLAYSAQLADELPMILGSLVFVYLMYDLVVKSKKSKYWLPEWMTVSVLVGYAIVTSILMALWTHSPLPMNISYMLMVVFIILSSIKLYREAKQPIMKRAFELSLMTFVFACACWMTEKYFCEAGMPVTQYLHAVWHLGAGFGTYSFLQWTTYMKAHDLKYNPQVEFRGILPIVTADLKDKAGYAGPNTRSRSKVSL